MLIKVATKDFAWAGKGPRALRQPPQSLRLANRADIRPRADQLAAIMMNYTGFQILVSDHLNLSTKGSERTAEWASRSLFFSRLPLFHTYTFLSKVDTIELLNENDDSRLGQRLGELLRLGFLVDELRRPVGSATSELASFGEALSSEGSASSPLDFFDPKASLSHWDPSPATGPTETVNGLSPEGEGSEPRDPRRNSALRQEPLADESETAKAAEGGEALAATVDLFVSALKFCRKEGFSPKAASAFLSLLRAVYGRAIRDNLNPDAAFDAFKAEMIRHSVQRPPVSCEVFAFAQLLPAADFFLSRVAAFLRPFQKLHGRPSPAPPSDAVCASDACAALTESSSPATAEAPSQPPAPEKPPDLPRASEGKSHASPRRSHHPPRRG